MFEYFTLWLWVLGLLVIYLCISVGLRWFTEGRERRRWWRELDGKGFDASAIAPQIKQVREQPIAALKARRQLGFYRQGLLAATRRWISQLSFFHDAKAGHEPHKRA